MDIIQFLSAFGLAAIITALVQAWLSQRADIAKRNFQEKKEAYVGVLDSFRIYFSEESSENQRNVAYWHARCELVASPEVRSILKRMIEKDKNAGAIDELQIAMRKDLGVQSE
jgi:hypothetical protein